MKRGLIGVMVVAAALGSWVWCSSASGIGADLDELIYRGDVNADGNINISDPVALQNYLYSGAATPTCWDACDANSDGAVNVSDTVFITNYLFSGGATPAGYANCY